MKLDFSKIIKPSITEDRNTIEGELNGLPVVISRRMVGWAPHIQVTLDGVCIHEGQASDWEKQQFTDLYATAWELSDKALGAKRKALSKHTAALYTK